MKKLLILCMTFLCILTGCGNTDSAKNTEQNSSYQQVSMEEGLELGSVEHPMVEAHYIEWVSLQTKSGNQRKVLKPGDAPEVSFAISEGDEVEAVYAYCNLHGLWKA